MVGLILAGLLIVLGAIAASNLIGKYSEGAKSTIDKLRPAQGVLGVIGLIAGIWLLARTLFVAAMLPYYLGCVCLIVLGLLLGVEFVRPLIKGPIRRAKFEAMLLTLSSYQAGIGVVSIVLGIYVLISALG